MSDSDTLEDEVPDDWEDRYSEQEEVSGNEDNWDDSEFNGDWGEADIDDVMQAVPAHYRVYPVIPAPQPPSPQQNHANLSANPRRAIDSQPILPISRYKEDILVKIRRQRVTCIRGETGCGKSTMVPQFILEDAQRTYGARGECHPIRYPRSVNIIVTQPRRLAAKSLAERVAANLDESVGGTVGYKIGQDYHCTEATKICYATIGSVLQSLIRQPKIFAKYTHVILDEVHMRELDSDLLSLLIKLLSENVRMEVKIVIMSASLQGDMFPRYFEPEYNPEDTLHVGSKCYPVDMIYLEDMNHYFGNRLNRDHKEIILNAVSYLNDEPLKTYYTGEHSSTSDQRIHDLVCDMVKKSHIGKKKLSKIATFPRPQDLNYLCVGLVKACAKPGESMLIFLSGRGDIDELFEKLIDYERPNQPGWSCPLRLFVLHSMIPFEDQLEVFHPPPPGIAHVILSTDIAENSVTLPNIRTVIDFGKHNQPVYDNARGVRCLQNVWCSRASCEQRAGRAGRVCEGQCIRMLTRDFYQSPDISEFSIPDIRLASLDLCVLKAKQIGQHFQGRKPSELLKQTIEPPSMKDFNEAVKLLADIGAIKTNDEMSEMTLLGRFAITIPSSIRLSRLILYGVLFDCPCDAIVMAAALQCKDPFTLPTKLVMKDQAIYGSAVRKSYKYRSFYDESQYSEPFMLRNMMIEWFRFCREQISHRGRRWSTKADLVSLRQSFGKQNAVVATRLVQTESAVKRLLNATLEVLDGGCEAASKIKSLLDYIPDTKHINRGIRQDSDYFEQNWRSRSLRELFTEDKWLINAVLCAGFSPAILKGKSGYTFYVSSKGRAGRVCEGQCIRMLTRDFYQSPDISEFSIPDIRLASLDLCVLKAKQIGQHFQGRKPSELLKQTIEPPSMKDFNEAVKLLADIGAIKTNDEMSEMTLLGRFAITIPSSIRLSRLILYGVLFDCPCDAIVMAAALQCKDPFTLPTKLVMKDQAIYGSAVRKSYKYRSFYDESQYSEPFMLRNMMIEWFRFCREQISHRGRRWSTKADLVSLRQSFGKQNAVVATRLVQTESAVKRLLNATLEVLDGGCEAASKIKSLLDYIPDTKHINRGIRQDSDYFEQNWRSRSLRELFTEDKWLINAVLCAGFSPAILKGKSGYTFYVSSKGEIKGKADLTEVEVVEEISLRKMREAGMNPNHSILVCYSGDNTDLVRKSLEKVCAPSNFSTDVFPPIENAAYLEFAHHDRREDRRASSRPIIADVSASVHEFTMLLEGRTLSIDATEGNPVFDDEESDTPVIVECATHPYKIRWFVMSWSGKSLWRKKKVFRATCEWRNPIGFACDAKRETHFAVAHSLTASRTVNRGKVEGVAILPSDNNNLMAIALLLAFQPARFGLTFNLSCKTGNVEAAQMFGFDLSFHTDSPMTEKLLEAINDMRAMISGIFNRPVQKLNPDVDLRRCLTNILRHASGGIHYRRPKATTVCPQAKPDVPACDQDEDTEIEPEEQPEIMIGVDPFYEVSSSQPRNEGEDFVLLKPYNVDSLNKALAFISEEYAVEDKGEENEEIDGQEEEEVCDEDDFANTIKKRIMNSSEERVTLFSLIRDLEVGRKLREMRKKAKITTLVEFLEHRQEFILSTKEDEEKVLGDQAEVLWMVELAEEPFTEEERQAAESKFSEALIGYLVRKGNLFQTVGHVSAQPKMKALIQKSGAVLYSNVYEVDETLLCFLCDHEEFFEVPDYEVIADAKFRLKPRKKFVFDAVRGCLVGVQHPENEESDSSDEESSEEETDSDSQLDDSSSEEGGVEVGNTEEVQTIENQGTPRAKEGKGSCNDDWRRTDGTTSNTEMLVMQGNLKIEKEEVRDPNDRNSDDDSDDSIQCSDSSDKELNLNTHHPRAKPKRSGQLVQQQEQQLSQQRSLIDGAWASGGRKPEEGAVTGTSEVPQEHDGTSAVKAPSMKTRKQLLERLTHALTLLLRRKRNTPQEVKNVTKKRDIARIVDALDPELCKSAGPDAVLLHFICADGAFEIIEKVQGVRRIRLKKYDAEVETDFLYGRDDVDNRRWKGDKKAKGKRRH